MQTELRLAVGAQYQSIGGNERRFDQYVTPPAEVYLSELAWRRWDSGGGSSFDLSLRDLGEPGPSADLWLGLAGVNLGGRYRRSTFYAEFAPDSERTTRRDYAAVLRPDVSSAAHYAWELASSAVTVVGSPTEDAVDWRNRSHRGSFGFRSGDYWLDVSMAREEFDVFSGEGLSGRSTSYAASFSPTLSGKTQWSGAFSRQVTTLDGRSDEVHSWDASLTLLQPVTDDLNLTGQVRRYVIDRSITRNAYARRQSSGRLEAEYRLRPGTVLTGYWQSADTGYVDGRQANIVDVGSNTLGLSLRSRLSRSLKFSGKFSRYDTNHRPLAYSIDGSFANSVVYSTIERLDLSTTYAPQGSWGVTGGFQRYSWDNDAQDTGNWMRALSLTGWWQALRGDLNLTASLFRQDVCLPFEDRVTRAPYTTRAISVVLGATYALSELNSVYANYADATASGATADEYRRLTLGASHETRRGDRLLAEVTLGNFTDDSTAALDYDADLYRLEWRHSF